MIGHSLAQRDYRFRSTTKRIQLTTTPSPKDNEERIYDDDGRYYSNSDDGQYHPSGDDGQYHPMNEGKYIHDNSGAYQRGAEGRYYPMNEGQYMHDDSGQYYPSGESESEDEGRNQYQGQYRSGSIKYTHDGGGLLDSSNGRVAAGK